MIKHFMYSTIALCAVFFLFVFAPNHLAVAKSEPVVASSDNTGTIIRVEDIYSEVELDCLSKNIYFESRNQSVLGQKAVAWVTLNRVNHKEYPNTICGVVWERKQFSWTHDGKSDRPKDLDSWNRAKRIARDVIIYKDDEKLFDGALFYHADYVEPFWKDSLIELAKIDNHIFYKQR